eukprot:COSAG02_NODE_4446_length_5346_cov_2.468649_3_plen_154_part_00
MEAQKVVLTTEMRTSQTMISMNGLGLEADDIIIDIKAKTALNADNNWSTAFAKANFESTCCLLSTVENQVLTCLHKDLACTKDRLSARVTFRCRYCCHCHRRCWVHQTPLVESQPVTHRSRRQVPAFHRFVQLYHLHRLPLHRYLQTRKLEPS